VESQSQDFEKINSDGSFLSSSVGFGSADIRRRREISK
jgi:hypothetical protein